MTLDLWQIDAFTDRPFSGNPAAVCYLDRARADDWMQALAAEMNLSETAFLLPERGDYSLRWFTPTVEVDLCGHATLASGHYLWESGRVSPKHPCRFRTRSGELGAILDDEWITLDFPATPARHLDDIPEDVLAGIGILPRLVARNDADYLVVVDDPRMVTNLRPDLSRLSQLGVRGVIVTAPASEEFPEADFISRFFAPGAGVPEDPVTGSTHCTLGPYWAGRLGRTQVTGYQASSRGGYVRVSVGEHRVHLSGRAVTVLRGTLTEPVL